MEGAERRLSYGHFLTLPCLLITRQSSYLRKIHNKQTVLTAAVSSCALSFQRTVSIRNMTFPLRILGSSLLTYDPNIRSYITRSFSYWLTE
jgi:hypothetical protein